MSLCARFYCPSVDWDSVFGSAGVLGAVAVAAALAALAVLRQVRDSPAATVTASPRPRAPYSGALLAPNGRDSNYAPTDPARGRLRAAEPLPRELAAAVDRQHPLGPAVAATRLGAAPALRDRGRGAVARRVRRRVERVALHGGLRRLTGCDRCRRSRAPLTQDTRPPPRTGPTPLLCDHAGPADGHARGRTAALRVAACRVWL